jgi:hypothetical protein
MGKCAERVGCVMFVVAAACGLWAIANGVLAWAEVLR